MNSQELFERQEKLQEAIDLVQKAMELVDEVVKGTSISANYRAYGKYGFDQLLGNGNRFDSSLYDIESNLEKELT